MKKLQGVAVSDGIAIGNTRIILRPKLHIRRKSITQNQIKTEFERFESHVNNVVEEIDQLITDISQNQDNRDILSTHKMILTDPEFEASVKKLIEEELLSLEQAINKHFTAVVELFSNMENGYFAQRSSDYEDVAYRLLSKILKQGGDRFEGLEQDMILITDNITPSEVTSVFAKNIQALCTERGSKNSHSSIIARSMNLPTLVNVKDLLANIENDQKVIVDGHQGVIIVDPDRKTLAEYEPLWKQEKKDKQLLLALTDKESTTSDGHQISLMSNIELPEELDNVLKVKSNGIGLFRTEFLFMGRKELPDEEEQFAIYDKIAAKIAPEPLIIRTIDVGGDKLSEVLNLEHELNPNLGVRGIRISLKHIPIFKHQIRAILRASTRENIKIMFPMISTVREIIKVKTVINECMKELEKEDIPFDNAIQIGAMIETPSAAITSDTIAEECDFLSIGTNDLIQYTLAVDRDNMAVGDYYIPYHPSVLRLIKMTADNCQKKKISCAVCGEMASEKIFIPLLLGLGINELSVSPGRLLMVKNEIMKYDLQKIKGHTDLILQQNTCEDVYDKILKYGELDEYFE
ncbi:MAG: phosphoenolpyruvate--protein phosphotransferase [Candidatus Cloacimonetes bacterium]|nr:phosphoenolpyruvate--protein phosphotransferase [Candidatus Cloacimonadota bacterium]